MAQIEKHVRQRNLTADSVATALSDLHSFDCILDTVSDISWLLDFNLYIQCKSGLQYQLHWIIFNDMYLFVTTNPYMFIPAFRAGLMCVLTHKES